MGEDSGYLHVRVSLKGTQLHAYTFSKSEVIIGRAPDSDIVLDNPGVSRQHAKLAKAKHGIIVIDLKSGNGTFVNGRQVGQSVLNKGDTLRINKFTLQVGLTEQPPTENSEPPRSTDAVASSTVFLRPEEKNQILQQSQLRKAPPKPATIVKKEKNLDGTMAVVFFAAGTAFGLLCSWIFG